MIAANELRIGNVIWDDVCNELHGNGLVKIKSLSETTAHYISLIKSDFGKFNSGVSYINAKGVLITPEILEKCGFERQNYGWTINKLNESDDSCFCLFDMNYNSGDLLLELNAAYCPCPKVEHLHQLQNLYFALCGEELNYTP